MAEFRYRPDVDGLRAVAVTLVLLFHAKLGFSGGFIGVDVFFVISGYLITGLILKQFAAGEFTFAKFWERRIRRILPASLAMVACTLLAGALLLMPEDYDELGRSAVYQQGMLANVFFWRKTGYFEGPSEHKPLLHTWSLAVEEQFYLFYPVLLVWLSRWRGRALPVVLGIATLASFVLSEWGVRNYPGAAFFLLPTRAWEMFLGGLTFLVEGRIRLGSRVAQGLSVLGLAAILYAAFEFDAKTRFPGVAALVPCLGAAMLIVANGQHSTFVGRRLSDRPLVFVGLLSYSLYLWHWPLLAFANYWAHDDLATSTACGLLAATVVLAFLSWRFVETPLRSSATGWSSRAVLTSIGGVSLLLLVAGVLVDLRAGFPARVPEEAVRLLAARHRGAFHGETTARMVQQRELPSFGDLAAARKCLVWGDSHAKALIPVIDDVCQAQSTKGWQATYSSTAPIRDFVTYSKHGLSDQSPEFTRAVVEYVIEQKFDVVIMAGFWSAYSGKPNFEAQLTKTIDELCAAKIAVGLVLDVAAQPSDVPHTLAKRAFFRWPAVPLETTAAGHLLRNGECNTILRRVAVGRATVLDPEPYLIDDRGTWPAVLDGVVLYRDSTHLTIEAAKRLTPLFENFFHSVFNPTAEDSSTAAESQ